MKYWQKLNEILVKIGISHLEIGILQETPIFHDRMSTWKRHRLKDKKGAHVEIFDKHNISEKFHEKWQKVNEIFVKIGILNKAPVFHDRVSNWKTGKVHRCNIQRSSYIKFCPIWFCGKMASGGQKDGGTDGRTDGWTDGRSDGRTDRRSGDYMLALRGA